ncbi:ion transporter [Patescibacteria group bacterium]|nr:ion transporter [Patescibacteria group bacterium]
MTIVSIASLILETVPAFASYDIIFRTIEFVSVFFFSLEYIGRLVAAPNKLKYIFSFFGIIDLLTILPTFLGLTNLTFLKSVRILRILRFLRMLRLAKILRQSRRSFKKEEQKSLYRLNVEIYFIALFAAIVIFGSIAYIVEGYRPEFSSIPISMIWSAKVLLGGVSLYMPETVPGEFVTIGTRFTGMVLFGLLITVVGSGIKRLLFGTTEIEKETKE